MGVVADVNAAPVGGAKEMAQQQSGCLNCETSWPDWTKPAYRRFEILQIGCWNCSSIHNIIDGEYRLVGPNPQHFIFWKDLRRQWNEALNKFASSAKKKDQ